MPVFSLSIKARLIAATLIAVTALLVASLYGVKVASDISDNMERIQSKHMLPSMELLAINDRLKEIRYRIAAVLLDQYPVEGAKLQLEEARKEIKSTWAEYKQSQLESSQNAELIEKLEAGFKAADKRFNKIAAAYISENRDMLRNALEEEWPEVHASTIKIMDQLIEQQVTNARVEYENSVAINKAGRKAALIVAGGSMAMLLAIMLPVLVSMNRRIAEIRKAVGVIASGDLRATVTENGDELGEVARSINKMVANLGGMIRDLQISSREIINSANTLLKEIDDATARANTERDHVHQISAMIEEISQSSSGVDAGAKNVVAAATQARTIAAEGDAAMDQSIQSSRVIERAVEDSRATINDLSNAAAQIADVTRTIKEIADQTNLLALNAAIEAARAGDQGRGFAVVADEVRKLAEKTGVATSEISDKIAEIIEKTNSAVRSMEEVSVKVRSGISQTGETRKILSEIVASSEKVSTLASDISLSIGEQSQSNLMAAHSMHQISIMVDKSRDGIHEIHETAVSMDAVAEQLKAIAGQFETRSITRH